MSRKAPEKYKRNKLMPPWASYNTPLKIELIQYGRRIVKKVYSPRIRARFQASSGNSDSANWYEAEKKKIITDPDNATNQSEHEQNTCSLCKAR